MRIFHPSFYLDIFRDMGVTCVVRLNEAQYGITPFGFRVKVQDSGVWDWGSGLGVGVSELRNTSTANTPTQTQLRTSYIESKPSTPSRKLKP